MDSLYSFDARPYLLVLGLVVGIPLYFYARYLNKRRVEALRRVAQQLGFRFHEDDPFGIAERYGYLDAFRQGRDQRASNVFKGNFQNHETLVFDFHYKTGSGKRTHHHCFSCVLIHVARIFPKLRVRPEGHFDKLGTLIGLDDIDFESIEFSKAYLVKGKDKKFAYDVFHTRMMEYFLEHPGLVMEMERNTVMLMRDKTLEPQNILERMDRIVRIRQLLPEYLFRN